MSIQLSSELLIYIKGLFNNKDKILINIGIRDELHSTGKFVFLSIVDKKDFEDKELLISSMTFFMVIIYIMEKLIN